MAFAIVLRVGSWGILRSKEMLQIRRGSVHSAIGSSTSLSSQFASSTFSSPNVPLTEHSNQLHAFIRIEEAKNRRALGAVQYATVRDPSTVE